MRANRSPRRRVHWLAKPCSSVTAAVRKSRKARARLCALRMRTRAGAPSRPISATRAPARCPALLRRCGVLLGGTIGTFDDVFERIVGPERRPVASEVQRALVVRRVIASADLNGLGRSARFGGFADALAATLSELESGLLEPEEVEGELARLYAGYRAELDRLGLWDRDLLRRRAADRLVSDLDAWHGEPVFAYGFEDLTGAEW